MIGQINYPAFHGYRGARHWEVSHPEHKGSQIVRAKDETSALIAVAGLWGERWQNANFYLRAEVKRRADMDEKMKGV